MADTKLIEQGFLSDEEYAKALGQFRLQLNGLMHPLRLYGQHIYVDQVTEEVVQLAVRLHLRLSAVDIPLEVEIPHW